MKLARFLFAILFASVVISGCGKKESVLGIKTIDVDFRNRSVDMPAGIPVMDIVGAHNIVVSDTFLLVLAENPSGFLQVYSTNSLGYLGSFCLKGRARNEFHSASANTDQVIIRDNHVIPVIFDSYSDPGSVDYHSVLKTVDLTASLRKGSTVVLSSDECDMYTNNDILLLGDDYDTRFEYQMQYEDNEDTIFRHIVYKNGRKKEITIFNRLMDTNTKKKYLPYFSNITKHPSRDLVVQLYERLDYLIYMDFETDRFFAVHGKGTLSFDDTFESQDPLHSFHFGDVASSSGYMMSLYRNGDYTLNTESSHLIMNGSVMAGTYEHLPEVLVFDWDGNYIKGFRMKETIHAIEYDQIHGILYGLDRNDGIIYSYDLRKGDGSVREQRSAPKETLGLSKNRP
ncbi:MAG: hypothetical protein J6V95_05950 [Bacteroidaceae bacterium]|nr:hypothetical protein [Bacteroidaceae bacterium]